MDIARGVCVYNQISKSIQNFRKYIGLNDVDIMPYMWAYITLFCPLHVINGTCPSVADVFLVGTFSICTLHIQYIAEITVSICTLHIQYIAEISQYMYTTYTVYS